MITLYRWPSLDPIVVFSQAQAEALIANEQCILEEEKVAFEADGTIPEGFPQAQDDGTKDDGTKDDGTDDQDKSNDDSEDD